MGKRAKAYMDWVKSTKITRQAKRDAHKEGIKGLIRKPGKKAYMDWVKGAEKTRHVHREVFKKGAKDTAKAILRKEDREDIIQALMEAMAKSVTRSGRGYRYNVASKDRFLTKNTRGMSYEKRSALRAGTAKHGFKRVNKAFDRHVKAVKERG
jgi:hypothetical protein